MAIRELVEVGGDEDERDRQRHRRRVQRALAVALLLVCLSSDYFLFQHIYLLDYTLLRHLVDNAAHGAVGFCCWGICLCKMERISAVEIGLAVPGAPLSPPPRDSLDFLKKCLLAGITASLLDLDHFIAAGALNIAGATHLDGRPFGHAVTFIVAVALAVNLWSRRCYARTRRYRVSFIVVAWLSHQLRDGMRLGLWFWPLGSTPPINYLLYLVLEQALPLTMAWWWRRAPTLTEKQELELALQAAEEEEEEEEEEHAAEEDGEDDRLLVSGNAMEHSTCAPDSLEVQEISAKPVQAEVIV